MTVSRGSRTRTVTAAIAAASALVGLPLVGAAITGTPIATYLEFPPLTRYVVHAPFHWGAFIAIGTLNLLMLSGIGILLVKGARRAKRRVRRPHKTRELPVWGWAGVAIMLTGWLLAWTRFSFFSPLQAHTFTLPWIGYIIIVNAWTVKRTGTCRLTHQPARFLALFPASAAFWWFFEYLNRFVQNWHYVGIGEQTALSYVSFASLAFSTVLPAVLSTQQLLISIPLVRDGLDKIAPIALPTGKPTAVLALLTFSIGLTLIGTFPDLLYPLVWAAPLLIITAIQSLTDRSTIFSPLAQGDWRDILSAALAALICGFFWEMWNIRSLARWEYAVPYVDCCHLFAMPIMGYGGYLPFGLECLAAGKLILKDPEPVPPLR